MASSLIFLSFTWKRSSKILY